MRWTASGKVSDGHPVAIVCSTSVLLPPLPYGLSFRPVRSGLVLENGKFISGKVIKSIEHVSDRALDRRGPVPSKRKGHKKKRRMAGKRWQRKGMLPLYVQEEGTRSPLKLMLLPFRSYGCTYPPSVGTFGGGNRNIKARCPNRLTACHSRGRNDRLTVV